MKKLMSAKFLQSIYGQLLYQQYQRLELKQLFQGNFDSQYFSHFDNYYVTVDIDYSRNKAVGMSSVHGQPNIEREDFKYSNV